MPGGYSRENLEGGIADKQRDCLNSIECPTRETRFHPSAPDVPAESESEASQTRPVLTSPRSDVPGPGTSPKSTSQPSVAEATLTRSAPDERVDSNVVIFPPQLSDVCGLVGRSIDSLRGNEAAEIGSKLHSVRSCFTAGEYRPRSEFISSI